jgi:hypothetical protein
MSSEVEIWFEAAPAPAAIAHALERFGVVHEVRPGSLRLVEGDERPEEGVPLMLVEAAPAPDEVRRLVPSARAALRASALLTGSRGFWLVRMAAELQRQLGGVVYLPSSREAFPDVATFEASWPAEHGGH